MILYEARYCDCIHESSYATISIHRTKEGAVNAIVNHQFNERSEFINDYDGLELPDDFNWDTHKGWDVNEIELLD